MITLIGQFLAPFALRLAGLAAIIGAVLTVLLGARQAGRNAERFDRMRTYRANFERTWSEIALRVLPRADDFIVKRTPGVKREEYVYDSTAQLALPAFAAAAGLLVYPQVAAREYFEPRRVERIATGTDGYMSRMGRWLRESF